MAKASMDVTSRRDPKNNLFLAGPAGNLLAPSYAGWKRPDGTYDKAYLAGLGERVTDTEIDLAITDLEAGVAARVMEFRSLPAR